MISLQGRLSELENIILSHTTDIESWFRKTWVEMKAPIMSSVDLRFAGFKLAPVDTNLFPAGFNNLNPRFLSQCVQAFQAAMSTWYPACRCILLIPEAHTRNQYYAKSLSVLKTMIETAGFDVFLGHWEQSMTLDNGLIIEKITRQGDRLQVGEIEPCLVFLNNDLSAGTPEILKNLKQSIYPNLSLGWGERRKSTHFHYYQDIVMQFSELLGIDPWQINTSIDVVDGLDFIEGVGLDNLSDAVDRQLSLIQKKYDEYGIEHKPFVVIKADNGTYGMSVMMVNDAKQVLSLNRKQRLKMAVGKSKQSVTQVLVQEGVYTFETVREDSVAEPVLYMIGPYVVGGFYRTHAQKNIDENLNAPGMHFEPLAFQLPCNMPHASIQSAEGFEINRFYVYGVIARLAALAAAFEMKQAVFK